MYRQITEVEVVPVKPAGGLVAFASLVYDGALYIGCIAVYTRPNGGYRLVYPTKQAGNRQLPVYYPISRETGMALEKEVVTKFEEVMNKSNDRHHST